MKRKFIQKVDQDAYLCLKNEREREDCHYLFSREKTLELNQLAMISK